MEEFFDWESENLANNIPKHYTARCLLNIADIRIGQSYVTTKIVNRYGKYVNINIQPGRSGIVLQETLFTNNKYKYAYLITITKELKKLIRKLPVEGFSDWLLIYDETLFLEILKGGCEEIEIIAI